MQEIWVQSLGHKGPEEMEMATRSGILAWEIPQRSLVGYTVPGVTKTWTQLSD